MEFGIPKLAGYSIQSSSHQKAHENYQALSPSMEDALLRLAGELDARGFSPGLEGNGGIISLSARKSESARPYLDPKTPSRIPNGVCSPSGPSKAIPLQFVSMYFNKLSQFPVTRHVQYGRKGLSVRCA